MSDGEGAGVAAHARAAHASPVADAYLAHHFAFRPVDATFMGEPGHDHRLPAASACAAAAERSGAAKLLSELETPVIPAEAKRRAGTQGRDADPGSRIGFAVRDDGELAQRLDRRLAHAQLRIATAPDAPSRFLNPAWYTGEAAFGIIGLLLPQSAPTHSEAVAARLDAIPDFLSDGRARLAGQAAPAAFVARAQREGAAMAAFLTSDIRLHADWDAGWSPAAQRAAEAFKAFAADIAGLADRPVACGSAHLELLMREAHGLDLDPGAAVRQAEADFARLGAELVGMAASLDPHRSWREQVDALADTGPKTPAEVLDRYRALDVRARTDGAPLVTVEDGYALDYRALGPCFQDVGKALYFLFYRSPPAASPGGGSVYWVSPPSPGEAAAYLRANADATVKIVHAVHHGSVGHHTQNARARHAASTLARRAGTDCALGLAFLSAGSMVEGWACYVQDMMLEAPGFYTPAEALLLKSMERRNVASVLVDVRLHTGEWTPEQARDFYVGEGGFAPARAEGEITRNAMLPATRLMYWLGVTQIRALRTRWRGDAKGFHDTLVGYGHVPVAWAGEEMARAGLLT